MRSFLFTIGLSLVALHGTASAQVVVLGNDPKSLSTRPAATTTHVGGLVGTDYRALLSSSVCDRRSMSILAEAGGIIQGASGALQPIVADNSMCTSPRVDGGLTTYSPNALIHDRYYNLRVTAAGNLTFTGVTYPNVTAGNIGDLRIAPLALPDSLPLPAGFVLTFPGGMCMLSQAASPNATTLHLQTIYTSFAITNGQVADNGNFWFMQGGVTRPTLRDLTLVGDPNPELNSDPTFEASRKYACDGVALECTSAEINNLDISNFPGHGLWLGYPQGSTSTFVGTYSPWDNEGNQVHYLRTKMCLTGLTVASNDTLIDEHVSSGCRDAGEHFLAGTNVDCQVHHLYGCGRGFWGEGRVSFGMLQTENCEIGAEVAGFYNQIAAIRAYNNKNCDVRLTCPASQIGSIIANHSSSAVDSGAKYGSEPSGFSIVVSSYCDGLDIGHAKITLTHDGGGPRRESSSATTPARRWASTPTAEPTATWLWAPRFPAASKGTTQRGSAA